LSVADEIILALKSVEPLKGIHEAQLLTSMKLASINQGFPINFNVKLLKPRIKKLGFMNRLNIAHEVNTVISSWSS